MSTRTADHMTESMARAGSGRPLTESDPQVSPKRGDRFQCDRCGMEIQVNSDCHCHEGEAHFLCCGEPMQKL